MRICIDLYSLDIGFLLGILGLDTRTLSRIGYVSLNLCDSEQSISWEVFHFALRCGFFFLIFLIFPARLCYNLAHFERSDAIRKRYRLKLVSFVHQWCLLVVKVTPQSHSCSFRLAFIQRNMHIVQFYRWWWWWWWWWCSGRLSTQTFTKHLTLQISLCHQGKARSTMPKSFTWMNGLEPSWIWAPWPMASFRWRCLGSNAKAIDGYKRWRFLWVQRFARRRGKVWRWECKVHTDFKAISINKTSWKEKLFSLSHVGHIFLQLRWNLWTLS